MTEAPEHNPFYMVSRASRGDLEAQRILARETAERFAVGDTAGFYEGLTYARMAAAQGGSEDIGLVLSLIGLASHLLDPADEAGRAGYAGQALAYGMAAQAKVPADIEAQFGSLMEQAMDEATPAEMQAAKYYFDLLRAADKLGVQ